MRRALLLALVLSAAVHRPAAAADRTFPAGSLIIPMDLEYQATGMFQAYGLVYQLLAHGVHVHWVIDPTKVWHANACNTAPMCAWDCGVEGSGTKCPYPTASPDFMATTKWIWDDKGDAARDSDLGVHGYRGGPFVIDAADRVAALAIIDAWNDPTKFAANPWANRSVVHVVTVHEATADFVGNVSREMLAAPTIAVFADGNEKIATSYLHAAGIPQSTGKEFPDECKNGVCGPGTADPDMLTPEAIAGPLGTCDNPNKVHNNGALFKADGTPAFCQIMSMHWGVDKRETFTCNPNCGTDPTDIGMCTGQPITFNGHEVVAEVRAFLAFPTHFFAECQAVNAYENTVPNPNYPWLDDPGRDGHFLTTIGTPPACNGNSCDTGYACVTDGCGVGTKCCLPTAGTWQNLPGFEVAAQPSTVKVLRPDVPYNQLDGLFKTSGGSEPAYNLSAYLGSVYKNNQQVTLITGPNGPTDQDVWMSGYLDGCQDIILGPPGGAVRHVAGCEGKISYLGGHDYQTTVPVQSGTEALGTRLFLNALFEAQCTTGGGGTTVTDSDGDGVSDGADSDPNDPNKCGDVDGDMCDDCASGHFDPANDCNGGGDGGNGLNGQSDGCCETGGSSAPRSMGLALIVGLLLRRRRRRA